MNKYYNKYSTQLKTLSKLILDTTKCLSDLSENFDDSRIYLYKSAAFIDGAHCLSAKYTVKSIFECCKIGSFADAYMLIRKYRDDLFQFVFFITIIEEHNSTNDFIPQGLIFNADSHAKWKRKNKFDLEYEVDIFTNWAKNDSVKNKDDYKNILCSESYKGRLYEHPLVKKLCKKFFNGTWEMISKKTNDYIHTNSINNIKSNSLQEYWDFNDAEIVNSLDEIYTMIIDITIHFISILFITCSFQFRSSDYIDYCEIGISPPKDSQYWILPSTQCFFNTYGEYIDIELKKHLKKYDILNMELEV